MPRILISLCLLFWCAVVFYFYGTGLINHYLAPDFRVATFIGGLLLAFIASFNLLTHKYPAACSHDVDSCSHTHADFSSLRSSLGAALLLVLPLTMAITWTQHEYSPQALTRKGLFSTPLPPSSLAAAANLPTLTKETLEQTYPKSATGHHPLNLLELYYATGDRDLQSTLNGIKVSTIGRWIHEKDAPADHIRKRLYRLFVTCCVADSRPIPIILDFSAPPPDLPENTWVEASGTMTYQLENGQIQPILKVETLQQCPPPAEENFQRF